MANQDNFKEKENTLNLKAEIRKYSSKWYYFVLGVLICLFSAFLYLRYATWQYDISTELLIRDDKKGPDMGGATSAFADLDIFKSHQNIDNEIEVLKSRSLLRRVFAGMPQLKATIFVEGNIKTSEAYGTTAPISIKVIELDSTAYKLKEPLSLKIVNKNQFEIKREDDSTKIYSFGQTIYMPFGVFVINKTASKLNNVGLDLSIVFRD
ncbi:MAG TPA: hypothetical protein VL053_12525, partial [Arachidicoccus sp.]|nr:hypothetical protein [Arachidicoccus sp.]